MSEKILTTQYTNSPNFFIIGAAKCGTTTLYHLLRQHPDIYLSDDKEPRFFNVDEHYQKGISFYLNKFFNGAENYKIRGDASPTYLPNADKAASRIKENFGTNIKFIVILRDPMQRAWSHYQHLVRWGAEKEDFETALKLEEYRIKEDKLSWISYFKDGLYAEQLEKWFKYFPRENFLILLTDDLKRHPEQVVQKAFNFLGANENVQIEKEKRSNVSATAKHKWLRSLFNRPNKITNTLKHIFPYSLRKVIRDKFNEWNKRAITDRAAMKDEAAMELRKRYHDDIVQLEKILNRNLEHWRNSNQQLPC